MLKKLSSPRLGLAGFYLVIVLVFSLLSPTFRTTDNLGNLLTGFSHIGIMAIGMTFAILLGGIDLSVGAIVSLVGMTMFDLLLIFDLPGWLAIPIGLLVGALAGLVNGLLVVRLKLNPFVATLATMASYRGLTYAISGRQLNPELTVRAISDPVYLAIDGRLGPIPLAFVYLLVTIGVAFFILKYTKLGIDMYAVGGNEKAAHLAGINIGQVKLWGYIFSGLCAAIAALVLTSRMNTSTEGLGLGFELSAIAAAVIGGTSMQGGVGNPFGPSLGAFLIGTLYIGMTLLGVTTYAQPVVAGVILFSAIGYDRFTKIRQEQELLRRQHVQFGETRG
ncbi:MAG: ABC transporter permease [Chloroflexi bacterium]|nr:ABC transporter permease [Chloroflexota bacterium]